MMSSVRVASLSDAITPFLIDRVGVRGRVVRLMDVAQTILSRYEYPHAVAVLLGELLVVAAMLSSNLKQEGIFTIQIKGQGLVPLIVVDAVFGGELRGFADVGKDAKKIIEKLGDAPSLAQLLGDDAYLAVTLDPGEGMHRYQGVVAVEGLSLVELLGHYFTQSQQLDVKFHLAVDKVTLPAASAPVWVAGGLMIERLPDSSAADDHEGWRYASTIASTLKNEELIEPLLDAGPLLYRLFHEEGVRVYPSQPVKVGCRCSRERILVLLRSMPAQERADMVKDGSARVHCQFCNTAELFTREELNLSVT